MAEDSQLMDDFNSISIDLSPQYSNNKGVRMPYRIFTLILIIISVFLVSACETTSSGLKNPKYKERVVTNAAILVVGGDLDIGLKIERKIISLMNEKGITVTGITEEMQFVTTNGENDKTKSRLIKEGVKEIFYIKIGDLSQSDIAYYQLSGTTTNTYGNNTRSTGTMTPMRVLSRDMIISCRIDDLENGVIIWKGRSSRHAQGLLFIGDDSMISSGVSGLISELENDQMF